MANRAAQQIIRAALQSSDELFSSNELLEVIEGEVTSRTLRRWLTVWEEEGVVEKIGKKKAARYRWISAASVSHHFTFLDPVPEHRRQPLLHQIRDLWTHTSTAIEGNTLTLGDTFNILEYGLTISGKPLREHQEIIGHARAIDLLYSWLGDERDIAKEDLFELHRAVQTERVRDINKPYGGWKIEPNGCNAVNDEDQPVYIEYAKPIHVDALMEQFVDVLNGLLTEPLSRDQAVVAYAKLHIGFVHVHPFWDGNGRMARLISNLPLLRAGYPPLVIDEHQRGAYIRSLSQYQIGTGVINKETGVWPGTVEYDDFLALCGESYRATEDLIDQAIKS